MMNGQEITLNALSKGSVKQLHTAGFSLRWSRCAVPFLLLLLPLHWFHGTVQTIPHPPPQPYLVKDIAPGANNGISTQDYRNPLIYVGNTLYVVANDGQSGWELWHSNGATNGTTQLREINPNGNAFDEDTSWRNVNGTLYFGAIDGENKSGLWKSNGTAAGTTLVKHYGFGNILQAAEMIHHNDILYFSLYDGVTPVELWQSDGTEVGTTAVLTNTYPEQLRLVGDLIYYVELQNAFNGMSLWKSDGTVTGTELLGSFTRPAGSIGFEVRLLSALNGALYFNVADELDGSALWKSDGTVAGTTLVKVISTGIINSAIRQFISLNGTLYFSANDSVNGYALWQSDGTTAGTHLLKNINPAKDIPFPFPDFARFVAVDNLFFFICNDGVNGYELWKSDGTTTGTVLVKDINPGPASAFTEHGTAYLTAIDGILYFAANDGVTGVELWRSDGTTNGTRLVADLHPGPSDATPSFLVNGNGTLYFAANDGKHGMELWAFNPAITPRAYLPAVLR